MTEKHHRLEPSFADAIMAITAATDLPEETRRHWCSSLTGIAKAFDQPLELIPARYSAIRARMAALHHVPLDWVPKTLANHKSNAKAALIWFAKEKDVLPHGVALSPAWDRLRVQLTDPSTRYRLLPLMRFCSGVHIEPEAVDEAVIDRYIDHRARTTSRASDAASRRILARLWNAGIGKIDGWPQLRLVEPPVKAAEGPAGTTSRRAFAPTSRDIWLASTASAATRPDSASGPASHRPSQPGERELVAAVGMAVKVGIPLASLTSLQRADPSGRRRERSSTATGARMAKLPTPIRSISRCRFVALAHAIGGFDEDAPAAARRHPVRARTAPRRRNDPEEPRSDPAACSRTGSGRGSRSCPNSSCDKPG